MATFIVETLDKIDSAVETYAETVFTSVGGSIQTVIVAAGLVSLALIAINSVMQFYPIRFSEYIKWAVRYVVILAVATTWTQFKPIYDILTNVPSSYGAELLAASNFAGSSDGLNQSMDEMVTSIFDFADRANEESSFFSISLTAVLMTVLGAMMACVAIIVSAIAKIGLALAISLAPVMIASLMFKATSQLFESWSRFTLGFALIPLVLAGVMGAVIGIGTGLIDTANSSTELSQAAGFIIVVLAAIFMMYQVPTLVNGLAGGIVAAAGAGFAASAAKSALSGGTSIATSALDQAGRMIQSGRSSKPEPTKDEINAHNNMVLQRAFNTKASNENLVEISKAARANEEAARAARKEREQDGR